MDTAAVSQIREQPLCLLLPAGVQVHHLLPGQHRVRAEIPQTHGDLNVIIEKDRTSKTDVLPFLKYGFIYCL